MAVFYECRIGDTKKDRELCRLDIAMCVEKLGLKKEHFCSLLSEPPVFDRTGGSRYEPFEICVVKIESGEDEDWEPGFYNIPDLLPEEAVTRLSSAVVQLPR